VRGRGETRKKKGQEKRKGQEKKKGQEGKKKPSVQSAAVVPPSQDNAAEERTSFDSLTLLTFA
jgi:hypothetical protein